MNDQWQRITSSSQLEGLGSMKNKSIRFLPADPMRFFWSPGYGRTRNGRMARPYTRRMRRVIGLTVNNPLKKQPGEGTGPTTHADSRGIIAGRVPSRGDQDVSERVAKAQRHSAKPKRLVVSCWQTRFWTKPIDQQG
jgi:hypothetical protein